MTRGLCAKVRCPVSARGERENCSSLNNGAVQDWPFISPWELVPDHEERILGGSFSHAVSRKRNLAFLSPQFVSGDVLCFF